MVINIVKAANSKKTKKLQKKPSPKHEVDDKNKSKAPKILDVAVTRHIEEIIAPETQTEKSPALKQEIKSLKELKEKIIEKLSHEQHEQLELLPPVQKPASDDKSDKTEKHGDVNDHKSRVEAILFAVGKYLDDESISILCELDKRQAKKALEELKKDYDSRNGALAVFQEGNSWKINVREKYLSLVRKIVADTELSKSIMETLAVIAWKSPIYQSEVVRIRGNKCYDHIAELENAGFVTKDKKGRSYVLRTTEKFYNYFDINQKNLQGVMGEAKMPAQTTLTETEVVEEVIDSKEKLLRTLETIETKSIIHTDDEKVLERDFLDKIRHQIEETARRTDEYSSDLPRPMHEQEPPVVEETPPPLEGNAVVEKDEEDIVISTDATKGEHHFQKPEEQPQKPKQLTKKQLEKKFKDELQRVKDKTAEKK